MKPVGRSLVAAFFTFVVLRCASPATGAEIFPVVDAFIRDGLAPQKDGVPDSVYDGAIIQVVNVTNFEDRSILEFPLTVAGPLTSAYLILPVHSSHPPFPLPLDLYAYSSDASASLSDFNAGTRVATLSYGGERVLTIDVMNSVSNSLAAGATQIGFNLQIPVVSSIEVNGPFVAFVSTELVPPYRGKPCRLVINDADDDGVSDGVDHCPNTMRAIVNADGCSIKQVCPCDAPWSSHRQYVRAVRRAAADFLKARLITRAQYRATLREAARSECGG